MLLTAGGHGDINELGQCHRQVIIDECASPTPPASQLHQAQLTRQQNLGRSVQQNSCYLAPVRWHHFRKRVIFRKTKNMEENNSRTAPSSTDACNSIVHALMCRRQGGNLITFIITAVCLLRLRSLNFSLFLIFTFR